MITLNDARRIIAAAEKKATEIGRPMNIAVVDERLNHLTAVSHSEIGWQNADKKCKKPN